MMATAMRGTDQSMSFAEQLLEPQLDAPPALGDLRAFLSKPPSGKIPINPDALEFVSLFPELKDCFQAASGVLARAVACSLTSPLLVGSSEMWTVCIENAVVTTLLVTLDNVLLDLTLRLTVERDQGVPTSLMTLTSPGGSSLRPDGVLRDGTKIRLLAKWEDKPAGDLGGAIADLQKKTARWSHVYYGNIEYLPCYAAAGSELQFLAISRVGDVRPISRVYDLMDPNSRAAAVVATINFYRLLRAQVSRYPKTVLPVGVELHADHPNAGFRRAVLFRPDQPAIRKRVSPWPKYEEWSGVNFVDIKTVYQATSKKQGVVHALSGPTNNDSVYTVDLVPVGFTYDDAPPQTEEDVRNLVHCLLHGLAAIHGAGFVHRDLRLDNIVWSQPGHRWFLIDLETCARADQRPVDGFQPRGWEPDTTLVDGKYTFASDLYQLGLLVQQAGESLVTSEPGQAFMEALCTAPVDQQLKTADLLALDWLRCRGPGCTVAGAQPAER